MSTAVCPICNNPRCEGTHFAYPKDYQPPQTYAWWPTIAGHCGKCGAPYTADLTIGAFEQPKFTPSCRCWNLSSED